MLLPCCCHAAAILFCPCTVIHKSSLLYMYFHVFPYTTHTGLRVESYGTGTQVRYVPSTERLNSTRCATTGGILPSSFSNTTPRAHTHTHTFTYTCNSPLHPRALAQITRSHRHGTPHFQIRHAVCGNVPIPRRHAGRRSLF
jgi:hypothetical protein